MAARTAARSASSRRPGGKQVGPARHRAQSGCAASWMRAGRSWFSPASTWGDGDGSSSVRPDSRNSLRRSWNARPSHACVSARSSLWTGAPSCWRSIAIMAVRTRRRPGLGWRGMPICRCSPAQMQRSAPCIADIDRGTTRRSSQRFAKRCPRQRSALTSWSDFRASQTPCLKKAIRFIADQPFTYLHLFPFSARPGTAAWALAQERPVHGAVVNERMARLRALIDEKQADFRQGISASRLSVVTLKSSDAHREQHVTPALSDNFLPVEIDGVFPANQMLWATVSHQTDE